MAVRWSGIRRQAGQTQTSSPSGEQFTIVSGDHRATLTEVGGGLRSYEVNGNPLVAGYSEDQLAPAGAGQVLAPWPNRIDHGHYSFSTVDYQVPIDEPERANAIHGLTRWLPWECEERAIDQVTLRCRLMPQPGYPWPLDLTTVWSISKQGLRASHEVVNVGDRPAPFGLGAHPYLQIPNKSADELLLQVSANWRLVVDDRMLPAGRAQTAGTEFDFRTPRLISGLRLDTAFTGLLNGADGTVRTRLAALDSGWGVELWQDAAFGWVQVYNGMGPSGREAAAVAVEPMTCPANAFNSRENLLVLQPGEPWSGSWGIRPYA